MNEIAGEINCLTRAVNERYSDGIATSRLSVEGRVEISVIALGEGVCRILGEAVECRAGDLFIFDKGLPHGFFIDGEKEMRVLTVSFSVDALDGDGEAAANPFVPKKIPTLGSTRAIRGGGSYGDSSASNWLYFTVNGRNGQTPTANAPWTGFRVFHIVK